MKLKEIRFSCTIGGAPFSVSTLKDVRADGIALTVRYEDGVLTTAVDVETDEEVIIERLYAVFETVYGEDDRIFLNGYESWTDSYEHGIRDRMRGLDHLPRFIIDKYAFDRYGDYGFVTYPNTRGMLHGFSYGYVRSGRRFRFVGSLSEDSGFTILRTDTERGLLTAEKDCTGLHVAGHWEGLCLLTCEGSEAEVFDRWQAMLGVQVRPEAKPLFGYTSWYRHYPNISEDILLGDLAAMQALPHRADVFQVDDGYQTAVGDWLSVDAGKFPNGMAAVAAAIRAAGMTPGLWMAPFAAEETSVVFQVHPDWFVKDADGEPLKGGSNWSGFYCLDIYHDEVRAYLRDVFRTVTQAWGYGLLKLDFLYAACILPRHDKTRGQVMADAMAFLREIAGDALLLGCGVPLASAFGRVDYCRIGCDVSLDWDDKPHMRLMHRERVSTRTTILDSVFRRQLNGRMFWNDPDVFLLRDGQTSLTGEQKQALGTVNALTGGVLFTSDDVASYTEAQSRFLARMLRLREAEVVSAEISGGLLKLRYRLEGRLVSKVIPL